MLKPLEIGTVEITFSDENPKDPVKLRELSGYLYYLSIVYDAVSKNEEPAKIKDVSKDQKTYINSLKAEIQKTLTNDGYNLNDLNSGDLSKELVVTGVMQNSPAKVILKGISFLIKEIADHFKTKPATNITIIANTTININNDAGNGPTFPS